MTITPGGPASIHTPIGRRRLLALGGGAVAAGALGGLSAFGNAGAAPNRAARRAAARRPGSGDLPQLSQWYHTYGEEGVQDAVNRYVEGYADAEVSIEWIPDPYETTVSSALLTDEGPDVFEYGNGPTIDMIQGGQVVPLDGLLGDAEADFNPTMLARCSYDGHLYAIPQMIDMQLLIYRKSLLEEAGIEPPTTLDDLIAAAATLTNGDTKGLFLGNDGGVGVLAGMPLWSAGADYLTADNQFGFATDAVYASFAKIRELYETDSLLLGAPTEWHSPGAFISGLTAMQWTGLWTFAELLQSDVADDFGVLPWPKLDASTGAGSVPFGGYASTVSAKATDVEAAKALATWLWVDQTDSQIDFATAYGFHVPVRESLQAAAETLASGPAAEAVAVLNEFGVYQTPLLWAPAAGEAYNDARARIIAEGADPAEEIAKVREITEAELERIGAPSGSAPSGSSAGSAPSGSTAGSAPAASDAPATTG